MKVTSNGISFNCEIDGPEGAPWITFSNSLCTNVTMWDDQVAALKDDFRLLRYDKRGHGGTDAPEGPYSFDMLVDDVVGLWDALDIEKSHFVGLSMGGMTALGLALDHGLPECAGIALGVDRLVMLACGGGRIEDVLWAPVAAT